MTDKIKVTMEIEAVGSRGTKRTTIYEAQDLSWQYGDPLQNIADRLVGKGARYRIISRKESK